MNAEQRFRDKVSPANANGCWLWTACPTTAGYGQLKVDGRNVGAHRFAWARANGPIPDGLCVLHRCDVRRCVNPAHLFLGTSADNNADMVDKGRCRGGAPLGIKNGMAKLNEAQAVEIFHSAGTQRAIGARYGVSHVIVGLIRRRRRWAHATEGLAA